MTAGYVHIFFLANPVRLKVRGKNAYWPAFKQYICRQYRFGAHCSHISIETDAKAIANRMF
jgi:hypothetical protein